MNDKFGYTILAVLNMVTIVGSSYSIYLGHKSSYIPLLIGITFFLISIKQLNKK